MSGIHCNTFATERAALRPLPAAMLSPCKELRVRVSRFSTIAVLPVKRDFAKSLLTGSTAISARGYRGAATMVRASIAHLRATTADGSPPRSRKERAQALSPRALRWLLSRKREQLDQEEQTRLDQLLNLSPEVEAISAFLQAFLQMVRERKHQDLRSWMRQAASLGIPEFKSFVTGIERDDDAMHAALCLPWSQGITEGKVNKLKTLKRVMYGRAGFALLRQRLLHDA